MKRYILFKYARVTLGAGIPCFIYLVEKWKFIVNEHLILAFKDPILVDEDVLQQRQMLSQCFPRRNCNLSISDRSEAIS